MKDCAVKVQKGGRITIPKAVRDRMNWSKGSAIDFQALPDGRIMAMSAGARIGDPYVILAPVN